MKTHQLKLATIPFEAIKSGNKIIESRLYDEKRREIEIGDWIEFTNRETGETLKTKVVGLHRFQTFEEMFWRMDLKKFGGESKEWLLNQISEFYPKHEQDKFGVVGIEVFWSLKKL
jgi:ASC-1-like (ASCH) protein